MSQIYEVKAHMYPQNMDSLFLSTKILTLLLIISVFRFLFFQMSCIIILFTF